MKIEVFRVIDTGKSTRGLLFIDGVYQCYTLEDTHRDVKIQDETRIPAGVYKMALRNAGTLRLAYEKRYEDIHKGMLWLLDVKGFEWIYIHVGNTDENTRGCLLVGNKASKDFIGSSRPAYRSIYPQIANAIDAGEEVVIHVIDKDP